jgi:hypothetical protein
MSPLVTDVRMQPVKMTFRVKLIHAHESGHGVKSGSLPILSPPMLARSPRFHASVHGRTDISDLCRDADLGDCLPIICCLFRVN